MEVASVMNITRGAVCFYRYCLRQFFSIGIASVVFFHGGYCLSHKFSWALLSRFFISGTFDPSQIFHGHWLGDTFFCFRWIQPWIGSLCFCFYDFQKVSINQLKQRHRFRLHSKHFYQIYIQNCTTIAHNFYSFVSNEQFSFPLHLLLILVQHWPVDWI